MRNRKETAWKKNRKFGDIKGGRMRTKLKDNIFNRMHNLLPPSTMDVLPIFIKENPSRDFFFPVSEEEIRQQLNVLPQELIEHITHIWFKKISTKEYEKEQFPQGAFICGSQVNLIVLFPFPTDMKMNFGLKKPSEKTLKLYAPYTTQLVKENENWILQWEEEQLKKYYLESLLMHEIGHLTDSNYERFWSSNYKKQKAENFANNFAIYWRKQLENQ